MRPSPIALVTGANRGIGREVCRQLAENRLRVLIGARDPAKGEAAALEMARRGFDVEAVALDVTDAATIQALGDKLGAVDVLINNAGVDYDTDQTPISPGSAELLRPISSARGRWVRRLRPACAAAAGAASST
jgi:NAD(P)-dependent dehydrogenase (short-subunit alcohol dehydrogenase family)